MTEKISTAGPIQMINVSPLRMDFRQLIGSSALAIWLPIKPGAFIMERGMLLETKERAENLALAEGYMENTPLP
ncbi:MAG TPA: hypothetical protein ENG14_04665 [Thermodesulforhabdus norvegica]|uniref:Uncharacterized protein n=1 Tax=Thermodesulforhabdus norvegica TaxID=39841 RepID=A0A7C1AYH8_9BACT|nr:hypothetical protein [Thermodesulforhabdus norvegica]